MGIVRTALVVGIVVAVMPSDPDQQRKLRQTATDAVHWAANYCDREPKACERGGQMWVALKDKAAFAAHMAFDLAVNRGSSPDQERRSRAEPNHPAERPLERSLHAADNRRGFDPRYRDPGLRASRSATAPALNDGTAPWQHQRAARD